VKLEATRYTAREAQAAQDRLDQILAMEIAAPIGDAIAAPDCLSYGTIKQHS
jgi:hypothetical protein